MLDYRIPSYQLLIGSFDVTDYVDEISLSLPMAEMGTPLIWTGRFRLNYNAKARSLGLSEDEFDSWTRPTRWRPAQVLVRLKIQGHNFPALRIDRYAYNRQTGEGEGTLTQLLGALSYDRPAEIHVGGATGASVISPTASYSPAPYTSVSSVVERLLNAAVFRSTVQPPSVSYGQVFGDYYGILSTRNPINDAQRLLGAQWQWLWVKPDESIATVSGKVENKVTVFTRQLNEIEWQPSIDHIDFAAEQVIVSGAYQRPATIPCQNAPPQPPNTALDKKGRPKYTKVQEDQPYKLVYTSPPSTVLSPTLSEVKWIFYQYVDDDSLNFQAAALVPTNLLFEIQSDRPLPNQPIDSPYQTITIYEQPAGRVFPKQQPGNANLIVAKIEIQSERRKGSWVPAGVIDPTGQPANPNLIVERYETVKTKPVIAGAEDHGGVINPATNAPICLTPAPVKEERQPLPPYPLETVTVAGSAVVKPIGWTPIYKRNLVVDIGFCPSVGNANFLAEQIALREWRRRDSIKITMPLPIEWIAAGCPPLPRVYLGDGNFEADGLILSMSNRSQQCEFAFVAARIDRNGLAITQSITEIFGGFVVEAEVTLASVSGAGIQASFIIEAEVTLQSTTVLPIEP